MSKKQPLDVVFASSGVLRDPAGGSNEIIGAYIQYAKRKKIKQSYHEWVAESIFVPALLKNMNLLWTGSDSVIETAVGMQLELFETAASIVDSGDGTTFFGTTLKSQIKACLMLSLCGGKQEPGSDSVVLFDAPYTAKPITFAIARNLCASTKLNA